MSHFLAVVLVKPNGKGIDEQLADLLAPYDENLAVPEHDEKCYCVGRVARIEARKAADAAHGTIAELRDTFHAREDVKALQSQEDSRDALNDLWREALSPWNATETEVLAGHPLRDTADPDCGTDEDCCNGTGTYRSTYNPQSKWDWWTVGGRWTGVLSDGAYKPEDDPDNIEVCRACFGARTRQDGGECGQCKGTGKDVKWPTQWKRFLGDVRPVSGLADNLVPFAIVTPDGEWHEKGKMGWWGMVANRKAEEDWAKETRSVLAANQDAIAVACDLHI